MKLELRFRDDEGRTLLHFLRLHYQSKAGLERLAKQAIRDAAASGAQQVLASMNNADDEYREALLNRMEQAK